MGVREVLAVAVITSALAAMGCSRTFKGTAVQPNPLIDQAETLRESEKITIVRGDMELLEPDAARPAQRATLVHNHKYPLFNEARFTVVSRDRLRFHVQVDHKWEEWADLSSWDVYLVDDKGRMYFPEGIEHANTKIITRMWDREQRSTRRNQYGDIIGINEDGWRRRQTMGSLSVFRGRADFVFYQRDLFTQEVRSMKLVVKRSGEAFEFLWHFRDSVAAQ